MGVDNSKKLIISSTENLTIGALITTKSIPVQGVTVGETGEMRVFPSEIYVCSGDTVWTKVDLLTFV